MTESAKATPPSQENPYPPPVVPYPPGPFNGSPYPPGPPGSYPPFFPYPPPSDGTHTEGAQNGVPPAPYMMFGHPPPGVMYAYPPHNQAQAPSPVPQALTRPKRKQVKMACTNCAGACKRCDETRPCERCVKYGIAESCIDGQRKERKKGIKRGPYKRKNKDGDSANYSGDWPPGSQPPSASATAAAIHAAQYAPEGYYPVYYPPPGTFMHHEGQSGPDGPPSHANGQPPMMPYYIHPGGYPPFPHYPPMYPPQGVTSLSGTPLQSPPPAQQPSQGQAEQPQTINPADAASKSDDSSPPTVEQNGTVTATTVNKKRSKTTKNGELKAKKVKVGAALHPEKVMEEEIPQPPPARMPPANNESDPESPTTTV